MKTKTFPFILSLAMALSAGAQVPKRVTYQTLVGDAQHVVIANQQVGFRLSIPEGSAEGDPEPLLQLDSHPAQVVAIKAIQELIEQVREQRQLIESLQERIETLESSESGR